MVKLQQSISGLRKAADAAYRSGDFPEAVRRQRELAARLASEGQDTVDARKLLSLYHFSAGEMGEALQVLKRLQQDTPEDVEPVENTGIILRRMGKEREAIQFLLRAYEMAPGRANICDALAHSFAHAGDQEQSQRFGRISLELKDREAAARIPILPLPDHAPPGFCHNGEKRNVISFSLWGNESRYLKGAIRNAAAAIDVYPGWVVRFYCDDSVPVAVRKRLVQYGVELVMRPRPDSFFDGLLWRFEVVSDVNVGRFLIRDCDSVVNVKERVAVDAWLASDKWFHAMRDYPSHTEVILAGMWGGVAGVLPEVTALRAAFCPATAPTRTFDQQLLREVVWPVVRQSVLIHDSVYTGTLGSVPFPEVGSLPPGYHVGQNEAAVRKSVFSPMPGEGNETSGSLVILAGLDEDAIAYTRRVLGQLTLLTWIDSPGYREWHRKGREFASAVCAEDATGTEKANLENEVLATGVRTLARLRSGACGESIGMVDDSGGVEGFETLFTLPGAKLLCVIRNPFATARNRCFDDVEKALAWGRKWKESLDIIARLSQKHPGRVELIRYEDLRGAVASKALAGLSRFFEAELDSPRVHLPAAIPEGDPLPDSIAGAIQCETAPFAEKLRYVLSS